MKRSFINEYFEGKSGEKLKKQLPLIGIQQHGI
jgi:hypothetical protein